MEGTLPSTMIMALVSTNRTMHRHLESDGFGSAASDAVVICLPVEEEQEIKTERLLLQGMYLEQLHLRKHHSRTLKSHCLVRQHCSDAGWPTVAADLQGVKDFPRDVCRACPAAAVTDHQHGSSPQCGKVTIRPEKSPPSEPPGDMWGQGCCHGGLDAFWKTVHQLLLGCGGTSPDS